MRTRATLLLFAASLVSAVPVYAQGNGNHFGRGHGKGNPHTDKQGPHGNGHHDDNSGGDVDLAMLQAKTAEVIASLASGSMTAPNGASIASSAQVELYLVMISAPTNVDSASAASSLVANRPASVASSTNGALGISSAEPQPSPERFIAAFERAGPVALEKIRILTYSLGGIGSDPRRLPTVVSNFNAFVDAAPAEFLASPPPEFTALHATLEKLTTWLKKN